MKAISLTQPWATLVVTGQKQYETRSWSTYHRGLIAIHASKGFPKWAKDFFYDSPFAQALSPFGYTSPAQLPLGAIIGVTHISSIARTEQLINRLPADELAFGDFSPERFGWGLSNSTKLSSIIPCKGALGLWTVPEELAQQIQRQIAP